MKKMNKYMKTTIITVIILALFTIAQRDKIIEYFEPKCIEEGCTEKVVEGTNYCRWHLISDDNDYSGTYHSGTVTTTTSAYSDNTDGFHSNNDYNNYNNYNSDDNDYDDDSDYTQETTSDNKVYKYHKRIQYDSSEDAYDDGYDDIYDDGDYDYDRYDNDEDYAEGVDDAMAEIDW